MTKRTSTEIVQTMLGAKDLQIAALLEQVEALQEALDAVKAKPETALESKPVAVPRKATG